MNYSFENVFELLYNTHVGSFRSLLNLLPILTIFTHNVHNRASDAVTVIFQAVDYSCFFLLVGWNEYKVRLC